MVYGGLDDHGTCLADLQAFSLATGQWVAVATKPPATPALCHHAACLWGARDCMLLYGGRRAGGAPNRDLFAFSFRDHSFSRIPLTPAEGEGAAEAPHFLRPALALHGDRLVVCGPAGPDVLVVDLERLQWRTLPVRLPAPVAGPALLVYDAVMHCLWCAPPAPLRCGRTTGDGGRGRRPFRSPAVVTWAGGPRGAGGRAVMY